jgi:hypothetical protein
MTLATGADKIAKAVGLDPRQIYTLVKIGLAPVRNIPGLGITSDTDDLREWLKSYSGQAFLNKKPSKQTEKTRYHQLYRYYADNWELLYVGISISAVGRMSRHRKRTEWFDQIRFISIEKFSSRDEVLAAEKEAIKRERPKFNKTYRGKE